MTGADSAHWLAVLLDTYSSVLTELTLLTIHLYQYLKANCPNNGALALRNSGLSVKRELQWAVFILVHYTNTP